MYDVKYHHQRHNIRRLIFSYEPDVGLSKELNNLHAFNMNYRAMDSSRMNLRMTTSYIELLSEAVPLLSLTSRRAYFTLKMTPHIHITRPLELEGSKL